MEKNLEEKTLTPQEYHTAFFTQLIEIKEKYSPKNNFKKFMKAEERFRALVEDAYNDYKKTGNRKYKEAYKGAISLYNSITKGEKINPQEFNNFINNL